MILSGHPDQRAFKFDQRWVWIKRPAVIVGGEMDLSQVEINYNPNTKLCEAPMQLKANCGVFVVDDFGRQRMKPEDLAEPMDSPSGKTDRLSDAPQRYKGAGAF